jgi:sulfide:quinone oxidoreductase
MSDAARTPNVGAMSSRLKVGRNGRCCVLIAGGGVAGLEALIALRTLAGDRVELELISPERTFAYRPMMVAASFGAASGPSLEIEEIARAIDAKATTDSVEVVNPSTQSVTLASGSVSHYDALVVAAGARPEEAVPGAITFGAPGGTKRFRKLLEEAEHGSVSHIVFAVPAHPGWPLALYELALLTAERLQSRSVRAEITLLTPEPAPLAVFGGRASGAVLEELEDRGVHFVAGLRAEELAWGELHATPGKVRIRADAVVSLPKLNGPSIDGLPSDTRGFIPVDGHGLVRGLIDVYAAGDAVAFPIKHGGLAAQQADAAAESIAARLGVALTPTPFHPVLRGLLLTGSAPRYLEAPVGAGAPGETGAASSRPLWWPPAKVAGRYLAPYLSGQVTGPPSLPSGVLVELKIDPEIDSPLVTQAGG